MKDVYTVISEYLAAHRQEMIDDLAFAVSFPSVKSAPLPGAPFGKNSADCLAACAGLYARDGFETELFADSGYALAYYPRRPGNGEKYTGIFAHSDVVPVVPEDWTLTEPFRLRYIEEKDAVAGRGCCDDKSAVIGDLYILRALRDAGIEPVHPFCMFIGSNEEAGMDDVIAFASEQPSPALCIVPDGHFPVSFGERAGTKYDIQSKKTLKDVLDVTGGSAYNTVLGALTCTLRYSEKLYSSLSAASLDYLTVKRDGDTIVMSVNGIVAHGGRPYGGDSALRRLSVILAGAEGLDGGDRELFAEVSRILGDPYGEYLGIAFEDPDMKRLTVCNGMVRKKDGRLFFTFDIRFGMKYRKDEMKEMVRKSLDEKGFELTGFRGVEAFKIDPESPSAKAFIESYRRISGKPDAKWYYMAGGTYSRHLPNSFSTGIYEGDFSRRMGFSSGFGGPHQADEVLGIPEWFIGVSTIGALLTELDKTL